MPVIGGNAIDHGFAYAGMVADNQLENAISKLNKGTDAIAAGLGVVSDGDDGAAIPDLNAGDSDFVGIVKRELNRAVLEGAEDGDNAQRDMTVVTTGVVWVEVVVTVAKDEPAYLVIDGDDAGKFSNVSGVDTIEIANAKWVSSADAGALAKVSLGLGG